MRDRHRYHQPRHYHHHRRNREYRPAKSRGSDVLAATVAAALIAGGYHFSTPEQRAGAAAMLETVAEITRLPRDRAPQAGDHWGGCNDARDAGTAPIYRGESGYRSNMDGDNDGIACE